MQVVRSDVLISEVSRRKLSIHTNNSDKCVEPVTDIKEIMLNRKSVDTQLSTPECLASVVFTSPLAIPIQYDSSPRHSNPETINRGLFCKFP